MPNENQQQTFTCFGLVIHGYNLKDVITGIMTRAAQGLSTWIVTANPEILLTARENPEYWEALREADYRLVDGFGLALCGGLKKSKANRVTGVDLSEQLAELCHRQKWTIALVGGSDGVADKAAWYLRKKYPGLSVFAEDGGKVSHDGHLDDAAERSLIRMREYEPQVVLVAYGHPKQEFWIKKSGQEIPSAKVFVGVGGTLDFWAGTAERAPEWMRKIGFEWLWRLIKQPQRWRRIWNAVVIFPLSVFFGKSKG